MQAYDERKSSLPYNIIYVMDAVSLKKVAIIRIYGQKNTETKVGKEESM